MSSATDRKPNTLRRVMRVFLTLTLTTIFAAGIVALMMVLAGYFEPKVKGVGGKEKEPTASESADRVEGVVRLVRRPRQESAVGTIRAVYEAVVASKILARVEDVRVKAGQDVKQGDVLVVLDKADLKSRIEQAQAAERSATAKYDQAVIEQGRAQRLRSRESITQSELDLANTARTTAKADLDRSQRAVEESKILEAYATVRAPMAGRVVDKKVNAGDTVSQGQSLLTMYDPTRMQLVATVRETLALRLKVGQELTARIDTLGYDCHATISEIVPEAQAESRSFQVKVTGPCPPNIYSGMFGRIFIPLEEEEVLVIPAEAVRKVGQLDEVDVVENGIVSRRAIQLGRSLDEGREVLAGLSAGERVVLKRPATGPGRNRS
jgi:membrane fusion protein (multidrug efflux system)